MSTTDNVVPTNGASYFGQTPAAKKSGLDMTTFLNLLVTQLQNQNPLEPMDDAAFYGQIAQLGQVQGMQQLNSNANLQQAQTLLGKTITAVRPTSSSSGKQGETFTGTVSSITIKNGTQYLNVKEANGGSVQIETSAVQSVLPTVDIASMSNLIGKAVSGSIMLNGKATPIIGIVQGITADNGQAIAQVKGTDGSITAVPVTSLDNIAG